MLQKLRDQTQGTGFKVLVGAIIVVLTLFGFGATGLFLGADPEIARVGDYEITQSILATEAERERVRILSRMGPDFDPNLIDRLELQSFALQQLINRQIAYQMTDDLGVRTPEDEINERLVSSPMYQVDGQFNEAIYRQAIAQMGYGPVEFLQEYTSAVSSEVVQAAVEGTVALTDWEIAEAIRVFSQRRDLAYLPLTVEQFRDQVVVSDEDVELRYDEEQSRYTTPLAVDVSYLVLSVDDVLQTSDLEASAEEIASLYEEERASAMADEQRASSHILIQINDDRDDAQALDLITEIATRVAAGEDFSELATALSEDTGSAVAGGSLGPAGKGIFDPAFEEALWALSEPGEVSRPVKTTFGYHLIRLDEIIEPEYPPLEAQRAALEAKVLKLKSRRDLC